MALGRKSGSQTALSNLRLIYLTPFWSRHVRVWPLLTLSGLEVVSPGLLECITSCLVRPARTHGMLLGMSNTLIMQTRAPERNK